MSPSLIERSSPMDRSTLCFRWLCLLCACVALHGVPNSPVRAEEESRGYDPPLLTQFGLHFEDDFLGIYMPTVPYHNSSRLEFLWQSAEPRTIGHRERFSNGQRNLDTGTPLLTPRSLYPRTANALVFSNGIAVGREAYIPKDFENPVADPDDRPFAGWLYLALITRVTHHDGLWQDAFEVDLGVVGPSALGEILRSREATKENQIPNEPALMISWDRRWMLGASHADDDMSGYLSPHVGLRLGSPFSDVSVGLALLAGWHTPKDFRVGRTTTVQPPELSSSKDHETGRIVPQYRQRYDQGSFYGFVGVEGRAVGYNAFLDGTLTRKSPSVDRNYFVGDLFWGIGIHVGGTYYSLTQVLRSSELRHDASTRSFGSFQFTATLQF